MVYSDCSWYGVVLCYSAFKLAVEQPKSKKRRVELQPAPLTGTAAEERFKKFLRPPTDPDLHCRDETAPLHPCEGKELEAGIPRFPDA